MSTSTPRPSHSSDDDPISHTQTASRAVPIAATAATVNSPASQGRSSALSWLALLLAAAALVCALMVWQRLGESRLSSEQRLAETAGQIVQAQTVARESLDVARDAIARLAVLEARMSEAVLARQQLEELLETFSQSHDETLLADLESAIRLAIQHAQMTGGVEPLIAALKSSMARVQRSTQPRLVPVQLAMQRDLDRLAEHAGNDQASLIARMDELLRHSPQWKLLNDAPTATQGKKTIASQSVEPAQAADASSSQWQQQLQRIGQGAWAHFASLVRISRIEHPEAALLAPHQAQFLRQHLELKLLGARMAIMARQYAAARTDLQAAHKLITDYFNAQDRSVQAALNTLAQLQQHMRESVQPTLDDTLSAIAQASARALHSAAQEER